MCGCSSEDRQWVITAQLVLLTFCKAYFDYVSNAAYYHYYFFLLEHSCFTMLYQFLLYSKVNQLHVYIYPLYLDFLPIQVTTEHLVDLSSYIL